MPRAMTMEQLHFNPRFRWFTGLETDQEVPAPAGVWSALPANLCPFSGRGDFARFRDDLGEPIGEPVEATARSTVRQSTTEHFQYMLSAEQAIDHAAEAYSKRGDGRLRLGRKMSRF